MEKTDQTVKNCAENGLEKKSSMVTKRDTWSPNGTLGHQTGHFLSEAILCLLGHLQWKKQIFMT